jgi:hypothetical protein
MMLFFDNQWMPSPSIAITSVGMTGRVRPQASLEMAFALPSKTCHHMGNANSSITSNQSMKISKNMDGILTLHMPQSL